MEHQWTSHYAMFWLYLTIVVLSIIVYKLGFAKKLPVLKSVIIYVLLVIGCLILTVLALQLPIVGALFIAAVVLSIYKIRLKSTQKKTNHNKQA
ncbi:YlaH-like family protein [Pullulanibacillus camelliae]|nr:YlaH-like family protein [Pullulanibacillus camelliae]